MACFEHFNSESAGFRGHADHCNWRTGKATESNGPKPQAAGSTGSAAAHIKTGGRRAGAALQLLANTAQKIQIPTDQANIHSHTQAVTHHTDGTLARN